MFHNKEIFAAALSDQLRFSSKWRMSQGKRYKDARNAKAAQRLLELESQVAISDDVWQDLQPLVSSSSFLPAISETNRDVGFRTHPADFPAWLENLHSNLTRQ
jgi:hypothetical protein